MCLVVELVIELDFHVSSSQKVRAMALRPPMARALHGIDHYNAHKELNYIHSYTMGKKSYSQLVSY